jgi:hypothetical protein
MLCVQRRAGKSRKPFYQMTIMLARMDVLMVRVSLRDQEKYSPRTHIRGCKFTTTFTGK